MGAVQNSFKNPATGNHHYNMTGYFFYALAGVLLALSFFKNRAKTKLALVKALNQLRSFVPFIMVVLIFVGVTLAFLDATAIGKLMGKSSGFFGVVVSLAVGSAVFMPSFVAFPLGATLLEQGAGYPQVAAFLAALMGVGLTTLPIEVKYFGTRITLMRNLLCLAVAICFVLAIHKVMA